MNSISVVICAYNEEKNVGRVIEETVGVLSSITRDYELIVVDDGSKDGTVEVVRGYSRQNPRIKVLVHEQNQGIGRTLLDGYQAAAKDLVTFLPADGQISPADINLFYEQIDGYDMAVSYYTRRPPSLFRLMTSKGVRLLLFVLFGPMPRYEGTYMFRREIFQNISLKMHTSFVLNYEFVIRAKQQGYKIKEVPTICLERSSGSSKVVGLKKILYIFSQICELRFKHF